MFVFLRQDELCSPADLWSFCPHECWDYRLVFPHLVSKMFWKK